MVVPDILLVYGQHGEQHVEQVTCGGGGEGCRGDKYGEETFGEKI